MMPEPIHKLSKASGFTLTETLVVLFAWILLLSFVPPLYTKLVVKSETNYFFAQFQEDFLYAQQYAITNRTPVRFQYISSLHEFRYQEVGGEVIRKRKLPDFVNFPWRTQEIFINANGNLGGQSLTLYFTVHQKPYRIIFYIGRARFQIYEEENGKGK